MNEPLMTFRQTEDGGAVRNFADGEAPRREAAAKPPGGTRSFPHKRQGRAFRAALEQAGHAVATPARAGFKLVARR